MTTISPIIREIRESDVVQLAPLLMASVDTSLPGVTWSGDPNNTMDKVEVSLHTRLFPPKSTKTYVLELPTGEIVGYGNIKPNGGPKKDEPELDMFFIKAGLSRQGYGSQLIQLIQKEWIESGLWLYAFKKNERAIRFYEKWGFELTEGAEEEWELNLVKPVKETAICMRWPRTA